MPPTPPSVGDSPESVILDLLEWIGSSGRPYDEVLDTWRTSCPRLPVWEDANDRGFIDRKHDPSRGAYVTVSADGVVQLRTLRPRTAIHTAPAAD